VPEPAPLQRTPSKPTCGPTLLSAAVAGLLCFSTQGCGYGANGTDAYVTSSKQVEGLDAEGFKALCDERGGVVEVMSHCGGLASGRGFSYDIVTKILAEHTCHGANTCTGWNCLTDD
jgi:hypothetical protein